MWCVLQTLKDAADHNKYVVLTKWASHGEYQTWLKDPTYRLTTSPAPLVVHLTQSLYITAHGHVWQRLHQKAGYSPRKARYVSYFQCPQG